MPRYHLHLDECGTVTPDPHGQDFADLAAARGGAIAAAREIMGEDLKTGHLCLACFVDIADDGGQTLTRLDFADALTITGLSRVN